MKKHDQMIICLPEEIKPFEITRLNVAGYETWLIPEHQLKAMRCIEIKGGLFVAILRRPECLNRGE